MQSPRPARGAKFHGGLADHSMAIVQYHTATHLLQAELRARPARRSVATGRPRARPSPEHHLDPADVRRDLRMSDATTTVNDHSHRNPKL